VSASAAKLLLLLLLLCSRGGASIKTETEWTRRRKLIFREQSHENSNTSLPEEANAHQRCLYSSDDTRKRKVVRGLITHPQVSRSDRSMSITLVAVHEKCSIY